MKYINKIIRLCIYKYLFIIVYLFVYYVFYYIHYILFNTYFRICDKSIKILIDKNVTYYFLRQINSD